MALGLRSPFFLWVSFLLLGFVLGAREEMPHAVRNQLPFLRQVRGIVTTLTDEHKTTVSFLIRVQGLHATLLVYAPKEARPSPGDTVLLEGRCELPEGEWGKHLERRGIAGVFWAENLVIEREGALSAARALDRLRCTLLEAIRRTWPEGYAELIGALLVGSRGEMDPEVREGFRRAGVAHLLALSGLHLGIIAYGLWRFLGLLRLHPARRYPFLFAVVALYLGLTGARISLVRAGIMFFFLGLFWILWERGAVLRGWYDPLQGLSAAAILILLVWPWSAMDLGFQLSFSATAGIVLGWPAWRDSPARRRLPRFLRPAGDILFVSLCAQGATLGFVGSGFRFVPLYGIIANPILVPWTALIIWAGIVLLALSPLDFAATLGEALSRYLLGPYLALVERLSSFPGAALPVGKYFGLWWAFAVLVIVVFWSWRHGKNLL